MNPMIKRELKINNHIINDASPTYVIAEIGNNHQGDTAKCIEMFKAAKYAGAHAVKLQTRDNRDLYTKAYYERPYENQNSFGKTYGTHRDALEIDKKDYPELQRVAKELNLDFFSTAFDFPSADFLASLNMPAFKIASGDLCSTPLLKYVAKFGKPVIISTGGGTMRDIRRAHDTIMEINPNLCIMQCTAGYPPEWDELNLRFIETLREEFPEAVIGFSSHDSGIAMAVASHCLGSRVIEKHFTMNRAMKGTDHAFSLEPEGVRKMCRDLERLQLALGDGCKISYDSEAEPLRKMGKSIYFKTALKAGHTITANDLVLKCPGGFMPPYEWDNLIGKKLKDAVKEEAPVTFELLGIEATV
jgi:sialic acid synthase